MHKKNKKNIIFFTALLGLFLNAGIAFALELEYPSIFGVSINNQSTLPDFVNYFFNIGIGLTGLAGAVSISYGGIKYLVSYSRGKFTSDAKDWIKAGLTGLLLSASSWLIMYTINPALVSLQPRSLSDVILRTFSEGSSGFGTKVDTYKEIPIGKLTETTLTRLTDCYAFDPLGNPIDNKEKILTDDKKEVLSPTFLEHDRVDCLLQYYDGAQKIGRVIAELSDEISNMMDTCKCTKETCNDTCGGQNGCDDPMPNCNGICTGACVKVPNSKTEKCQQAPNKFDCCPQGVKEQIEHGQVTIGGCENISLTDPVFPSGPKIEDRKDSHCEVKTMKETCQSSQDFKITETLSISLGEGVSRSAVQWAINQLNSAVNLNYSLFSIDGGGGNLIKIGDLKNPLAAGEVSLSGISNGSISGFEVRLRGGNDHMVILHELAHVAGLGDMYDTQNMVPLPLCNGYSIMDNPHIMNSLGFADKNTLQKIYAPSGTVSFQNSLFTIGNQLNDLAFPKAFAKATCSPPGNTTGGSCCDVPPTQFRGLDEFRCDPKKEQCSNIASLIEDTTQKFNKKTITLINIDGNQGAETKKKWNELKLIQKLTYFKEKINKVKEKINEDSKVLEQAAVSLGQCYLAVPYVDLFKTYETTDKQKKVLTTKKVFSDPETKELIDASVYCKGYNYANSECLKKCNNECPDNSEQALELYKSCSECDDSDTSCLNKQAKCIEKAYAQRPCLYKPDEVSYKTWGECVSYCQNDCTSFCGQKFLSCERDFNICKDRCENNGKCVIDNASSCLINAKNFVSCAYNNSPDKGSLGACLDTGYLCKNGSSQYAGYQDCINTQQKNAIEGKCSVDRFSSSFLYDHPQCEKCPNPYSPPEKGSVCYSKENPDAVCQDLCPETSKCPDSSMCPECSCDEIDKTIEFAIPNFKRAIKNGADPEEIIEKDVSAHQIVGPQCNEAGFNDDPLNFYCLSEWWNNPNKEGQNPTPIGQERVCEQSGEIPVGQMVDDTKKWASSIGELVDKEAQSIDTMIKAIEKIGKTIGTNGGFAWNVAQDYCKCNAKLENANVICSPDCQYSEWFNPVQDADGNFVGMELVCGCLFTPCDGKPCEQMTTYLSGTWVLFKTLKTQYIDFYTEIMKDPRSDILKKLTYARQKVNDCSLVNVNYNESNNPKNRLFSCTRVEDELMPPINTGSVVLGTKEIEGYCYGKNLGKLYNTTLTDNWFCCQEYQKVAPGRKQPK